MAGEDPETTTEPQIVFRAGKKRKAYRQRPADQDAPVADEPSAAAPRAVANDEGEGGAEANKSEGDEEGLSVAEALRLRNARRTRLGGVGFSATAAAAAADNDEAQRSLVLRGEGADPLELHDMSRRFAPQTGLVHEMVNKHMHGTNEDVSRTLTEPPPDLKPRPAMQGKLQEVDLGEEARARNIAMTERARRRLEGHSLADDDDDNPDQRKKVRLGPDGKPWRSRKRRASDDVKRDQIIEQFLSENRLDVYDVQGDQTRASAEKDDEDDADDRAAEEFRREFMDAQSQRQQRKRPAINAPRVSAKAPVGEVLKGPKLGGSRNVRSQVRDVLLREQERKR